MGLICDLIANKHTSFTEDDRVWLQELDEEQLKKMVPVDIPVANSEGRDVSLDTDDGEPAPKPPEAPKSAEEFIANAPEEMRDVLSSGLKMHRQKKEKLVEALVANKRCTFTKEQLQSKGVSELEALVALSQTEVDYSGAAPAATVNQDAKKIEPLLQPEWNWKK